MNLKKKLHKNHSIKNEWFFICLAKITKKLYAAGQIRMLVMRLMQCLKKEKKHAPGRTIFLHVFSLSDRMQF